MTPCPPACGNCTPPDRGPSEDPANRRRSFLGLPVTWTPTTWIFRQNGQLAYAFNYGELDAEALQRTLDDARNPWTHDQESDEWVPRGTMQPTGDS